MTAGPKLDPTASGQILEDAAAQAAANTDADDELPSSGSLAEYQAQANDADAEDRDGPPARRVETGDRRGRRAG